MKLTIIGGGGFRTPQILEAVQARTNTTLNVTEVALYDISQDRLDAMNSVLRQRSSIDSVEITSHTDLEDAVKDASFVFSAMRVSGTKGRIIDEQVALNYGVLGQETVGPGGYSYALRTIPQAQKLARAVKEHAPNAWVTSFTNPAGIITQAMRQIMGPRVIGICDTPIGLVRRVARVLGVSDDSLDFDYVGLNHLGWLRSAKVDGKERLPEVLEDDRLLMQIEEARIMGLDWVRQLGMLPNEYLFYYYRGREAVAQLRSQAQTRGEFLDVQQSGFYEGAKANPDSAGDLWERIHKEREATYMKEAHDVAGDGPRLLEDMGGGYQDVALNLMTALSGAGKFRMILGIANNEDPSELVIPGLPEDAIVEVPCNVSADGIQPLKVAPLQGAELGLVQQVKACEYLVIDAVTRGDKGLAWQAIASHPLVDSVEVARLMLDAYCAQIPEVAAVFSKSN